MQLKFIEPLEFINQQQKCPSNVTHVTCQNYLININWVSVPIYASYETTGINHVTRSAVHIQRQCRQQRRRHRSPIVLIELAISQSTQKLNEVLA